MEPRPKTRRVSWSTIVLAGVVLSALTLGPSYTYCLDGPARGWPFAVVRPAHGSAPTAVYVGVLGRVPTEVDLFGAAGNLSVWILAVAVGLTLGGRLRG